MQLNQVANNLSMWTSRQTGQHHQDLRDQQILMEITTRTNWLKTFWPMQKYKVFKFVINIHEMWSSRGLSALLDCLSEENKFCASTCNGNSESSPKCKHLADHYSPHHLQKKKGNSLCSPSTTIFIIMKTRRRVIYYGNLRMYNLRSAPSDRKLNSTIWHESTLHRYSCKPRVKNRHPFHSAVSSFRDCPHIKIFY